LVKPRPHADDVDADRRARLFPAPAEALERRARSVSSPENKLNLMGAPDEEFRASFARARGVQLFGHPRRQFFETPETCLAYLKYKSHTNAAERLEYLVDSGEVERTKHANDIVTYRRIE